MKRPSWAFNLAYWTAALSFLVAFYIDEPYVALLLKGLPLLLLCIWVTHRHDEIAIILVVTLLFSAAGDLLLHTRFLQLQPHEQWARFPVFSAGLAAFLIAQLLYVAALTMVAQTRLWPLFIATGVGVTVAYYWIASGKMGAMLVPALIYTGIVCMTLWRALCLWGQEEWRVALYASVGAALFVVSSILVALDRFVVQFEAARALILLTYWVAQWLLVVALMNCDRREVL